MRRRRSAAFHRLYRLAWASRPLLGRVTSARFRDRIERLLRRGSTPPASGPRCAAPAFLPGDDGLNVIGYLGARSGLGEAARCTLRAARAVGLPASAVDFTLGCPSGRESGPDSTASGGRLHGVNVLLVNPDRVGLARAALGEPLFRDRYNIAFRRAVRGAVA